MSLQVGGACYASTVDAGAAACSQFLPVSSISGGKLQTATCAGFDSGTGALLLNVVTTDIASGVASTVQISQLQSFPVCIQNDYLFAAEIVFGGLLGLWALAYGAYKILGFLSWSRGQND